jgi:hypothetical protein
MNARPPGPTQPPVHLEPIQREATEWGAMAAWSVAEKGERGEKIWRLTLWVFSPCNPLKSQETAKGIFGNPWMKTC